MDRRDFVKHGIAVSGVAAAALPSPAPRDRFPRPSSPIPGRERLSFDRGWRFAFGHATDPAKDFGFGLGDEFKQAGAVRLSSDHAGFGFDDSGWRPVDLPHDWAVELPFERHDRRWLQGSKPVGWPFPATSVGWYRRTFEIPEADRGRRLTLTFDGIFRDSVVTLNGYLLGRHAPGYTGQAYDISDLVTVGGRNIVAVRVDASQSEGWFYEGAGIYRHTWLGKTAAVHLVPEEVVVRSVLDGGRAVVSITTEVANDAGHEVRVRLGTTILDSERHAAGLRQSGPVAIAPGQRHRFEQRIVVRAPKLWSPETPWLYQAMSVLSADGSEADRHVTRFGIKTVEFHARRGFLLNGATYPIRGTCNHQDFAGVGVAVPDAVHRYRVDRLKSMGANAYRSHHPSTPELLDACDEAGLLVLAETRAGASTADALPQLEWMVRRDRNRACVLGWSLGNQEIYGGTERGSRILASMRRVVRALDPTRPVTFPQTDKWGESDPTVVDVLGMQYPKAEQIDEFHRKFPAVPILGTEVASTVSTRGVYAEDKANGHSSTFEAYLKNRPGWGCTPGRWLSIFADRPYLAGGFVWAGFDYRGEPNPYQWPGISSQYGVFDTCGFPKDHYYAYQAWWTDRPVLHLFPHWNWRGLEGQEVDVYCHTNLDRVELTLNGRSLGAQTVARFTPVVWKVPYQPGTLEARGFRGGKPVLVAERSTTGAPAGIELVPDRTAFTADGDDVVLVEFRIVDAAGRVVPVADNEVAFGLTGPGRIIGVGNGNPSSHEPDHASQRRAFNGLGLALIREDGERGDITVTAESAGLVPAVATIRGV